MARILEIEEIAPAFKSYIIHAPVIARRHRAGQFVIVRVREGGERIPLTITDYDRETGLLVPEHDPHGQRPVHHCYGRRDVWPSPAL